MGLTTLGHARQRLRQQEDDENPPGTARPSALKRPDKASDHDDTRSVASSASSMKRVPQGEQAPTTGLAQKKKAKIAERKARAAAASGGGTVTGAAAQQQATSSSSRVPDKPMYNISSRASAAGSVTSERGSVSTRASEWAMVEEDVGDTPDTKSSASDAGTRPKASAKLIPTAKVVAKAATGITAIRQFKPTGAVNPLEVPADTGYDVELAKSTAAFNMIMMTFAIGIFTVLYLLMHDKTVNENPTFIRACNMANSAWEYVKHWLKCLRRFLIRMALKIGDEEDVLVAKKVYDEVCQISHKERVSKDAKIKVKNLLIKEKDLEADAIKRDELKMLIMEETSHKEQKRYETLRNAAIEIYLKSDPRRFTDENWAAIFADMDEANSPPKPSTLAATNARPVNKGERQWCTAYSKRNTRDATPDGYVIVNKEFDDGEVKMPSLPMHLKDGHFIILGAAEHGKRAHRDYQCPTVQSWVRGQFHDPTKYSWYDIAAQMHCMVPCKDCFPLAATHDIYRFKDSHLRRAFDIMTQANVSFARHHWPQSGAPNSNEYLEKHAVIYDKNLATFGVNRHASKTNSALLRKYEGRLVQPGIIMPKENFLFNVRRLMSYTKVVQAADANRPRLFCFPILKYKSFHVTDDKVGYKAKVEYPLTDRMNDEIWLGYNRVHKCIALWERIRPLGYVFFGGAHREISHDKDGNEDLVGYWPTPVCDSYFAPMPANSPHPYAINDSEADDGNSSVGSFSVVSSPRQTLRHDFPRAAYNEDVDLDNSWYDAFGNRRTGNRNATSSNERDPSAE